MTKEINPDSLALFRSNATAAGTTYGFNADSGEHSTSYASYEKSSGLWRTSMDVTIGDLLNDVDGFTAINSKAVQARFHHLQPEPLKPKFGRMEIVGRNGNNGEHYELTRDQVIGAISENLPLPGKAGLPLILDAIEQAGLVISAVKSAEVAE